MDDKKICFILCSNNQMLLDECFEYINRLVVPEGYEIDALVITEAKSMTSGYNEGMRLSNAKYKIYMHQDVFIINRFFLQNIIDIFTSDSNIGAVGLVGYKGLGDVCCMWLNPRYGIHNTFGTDAREYKDRSIEDAVLKPTDQIYNVMVTDGLLLATSVDVEWDEEFDGWDFYDASQGVRINQNGFKVVVPNQNVPWFVHDDGKYLSVWNYNKYRKLFVKKYGPKLPDLEKVIRSRVDTVLGGGIDE